MQVLEAMVNHTGSYMMETSKKAPIHQLTDRGSKN
jgi:hypothetical protein